MDELTRRALLGDKEAQEEFTKREKLLPCPYCDRGGAKLTINRNLYQCYCPECLSKSDGSISRERAIEKWNTRPPLVVFCKDCVHYDGGSCEAHSTYADEYSTGYDFRPDDYDFCSMGKRRNTDE